MANRSVLVTSGKLSGVWTYQKFTMHFHELRIGRGSTRSIAAIQPPLRLRRRKHESLEKERGQLRAPSLP